MRPGTYLVRCIGIEDAEGQFGPQILWKFHLWAEGSGDQVMNDEGDPHELFAWSSTKLTTGGKGPSKGRQWAEALLGREITGMSGAEVGAEVIGKAARALVSLKPKKDGTGSFPQIADMFPMAGAENAAPVQAAMPESAAIAAASAPAGEAPAGAPPWDRG